MSVRSEPVSSSKFVTDLFRSHFLDMSFLDYFSSHASEYAKYRPHYPEALIEYLATTTPEHEIAWDCGTGNGQVALNLADRFQQIYATDASEQQISQAAKHDRIRYWVTKAESTDIASSSIDLITVAQALHWFNLEEFYREVRRVLKPNGVIAVWCYGVFTIPSASDELNQILKEYYQTVDFFWPPERKLIDTQYQTIPFPFLEKEAPSFAMASEWNAEQTIGYLATWSATKRFIDRHGSDRIQELSDAIASAWGSDRETKLISWPLSLRIGIGN